MSEHLAGASIAIGGIEIQTIDRVVIRVEEVVGTIVGVAVKEPIAVIVRSPTGTWRLDLEGPDPHEGR